MGLRVFLQIRPIICATSCRLRAGDVVEIFDGKGSGYTGEVEFQDTAIFVRGLRSITTRESRVRVMLAAALIKSSKYEWILQKATELGVQEIIPLNTRRSDIEIPGGRIADRLQRWDRIVMEASKQCRRSSCAQNSRAAGLSGFSFDGRPLFLRQIYAVRKGLRTLAS